MNLIMNIFNYLRRDSLRNDMESIYSIDPVFGSFRKIDSLELSLQIISADSYSHTVIPLRLRYRFMYKTFLITIVSGSFNYAVVLNSEDIYKDTLNKLDAHISIEIKKNLFK